MKDFYLEEIEELTNLLRKEEDWDNSRRMLKSNGFEADKILLVALMESEECKEYGVFVSEERRVYQWVVDTNGTNKYVLISLQERTNDEKFYNEVPQIRVGLEAYENT